jgi:hypothetical protein
MRRKILYKGADHGARGFNKGGGKRSATIPEAINEIKYLIAHNEEIVRGKDQKYLGTVFVLNQTTALKMAVEALIKEIKQ